ncbi:DUF418 domain-containing protein [Natribacillus halophilus]|uniref:DUF418 domain-containing protein n=1 Tax=Natribacillus halophilus TaxID=549003 RepID=A0A1G8R3B5_9BACI|nr:DUF418 domain-containing protein [Natribacillus halophilus]SDJ10890.1 uncharacterized protein SAMN04488123_11510 [Natribacillus halophilus]
MNASATTSGERLHTLDIIRGIAVFGILIANMYVFKALALTDVRPYIEGGTMPEGAFNQFADVLNTVFVEGKFYPMFSLLFGLGFFIFYNRLLEKDVNADRVFVRRLLFLLVIGLVHLVFLWTGDILHTYALAGFLLVLFIHRQPKTIMIWTVALLGVSSLFALLFIGFTGLGLQLKVESGFGSLTEFENSVETGTAVMANGSYGEILQYRLVNEVIPMLMQAVFMVISVLPLFLIGLYMGKKGMFHDMDRYRRSWKKLCIHSFWSGGLLTVLVTALHYDVIALPTYLTFGLSQGLNFAAGPLLMLFYVSALVLFLRAESRRKWLMPFAAVGRMALTNYLLQTVIAVFIFYGFGLGMFGQISSGMGLLIAVIIYAGQMILSNLYLQTFNQGPLEALWRKWTYKF